MLFFPPQVLTAEQHIALASVFGEIAPGAFFPRKDGHPNVEVIEFDEARPQPHAQHRSAWSQEIDLRPFKEAF